MFSWQEYCKELAEYFIEKYKPTKLEILEVASKGGWKFWNGEKFPYPITKKQLSKYDSLGGDRECLLSTVYEYFLAYFFLEFDMDFIVLFAFEREFWQLNLVYYKHKQKTIFEEYAFPKFDWDAWGKAIHNRAKNFTLGIVDDKVIQEDERQTQLLRSYGDKIMQIAVDAVAYLGITGSR